MNLPNRLAAGFVYQIDHLRGGLLLSSEVKHNLMPTEGQNYLLGAGFKGAAQVSTWYLGLYEGNYTPTVADVAATFPGLATECTAYAEATRIVWNEGSVASGAVDNSASRAEFTMNADKTIYGGFMSSVAAKGSTSGTLGSVVRFSSPKVVTAGDVLRITAGFILTSA